MNEEPPSKDNQDNVDFGSGIIPTANFMAERFKNIGAIWASSWDISPIRSTLHGRCYAISGNFQKR